MLSSCINSLFSWKFGLMSFFIPKMAEDSEIQVRVFPTLKIARDCWRISRDDHQGWPRFACGRQHSPCYILWSDRHTPSKSWLIQRWCHSQCQAVFERFLAQLLDKFATSFCSPKLPTNLILFDVLRLVLKNHGPWMNRVSLRTRWEQDEQIYSPISWS